MPWDAEFDEPIRLPSGKVLKTLRDAGEYIAALPAKEHAQPKWQAAMTALLVCAEGGPTMFAQIGLMRAILPLIEPVYDRTSKDAHWGRRKLARERR